MLQAHSFGHSKELLSKLLCKVIHVHLFFIILTPGKILTQLGLLSLRSPIIRFQVPKLPGERRLHHRVLALASPRIFRRHPRVPLLLHLNSQHLHFLIQLLLRPQLILHRKRVCLEHGVPQLVLPRPLIQRLFQPLPRHNKHLPLPRIVRLLRRGAALGIDDEVRHLGGNVGRACGAKAGRVAPERAVECRDEARDMDARESEVAVREDGAAEGVDDVFDVDFGGEERGHGALFLFVLSVQLEKLAVAVFEDRSECDQVILVVDVCVSPRCHEGQKLGGKARLGCRGSFAVVGRAGGCRGVSSHGRVYLAF
mmetsp:Transcript_11126/g.28084  ORF Transcript_11126/g.28084 Transcript_11126/m.28084 type:complete len:311 (-) Transcript_11126:1038-1970(-)